MKIELKPIDSIIPYARNPRRNEKAIPKVKASLKEFGFRQPIVVDTENVIVVGHTRWLAAKELGLKEVPVHVADNLTSAQIQAYRITDNRTNQDSEWDSELLAIELGELKSIDFDLSITGFDSKEIDLFVSSLPNFNPNVEYQEVSNDDIDQAQSDIDDRIDNMSKQELITLMCPHCGEEFSLNKPDIR
jgi:ParB-like chromosome segregation protein Spo0J